MTGPDNSHARPGTDVTSDADTRFEAALDAAMTPQAAPPHLRAQIMARVSADGEAGLGRVLRPRFALPVAAFALSCLIGGYTAGSIVFDSTDLYAADLASAIGLSDAGVITEDLL